MNPEIVEKVLEIVLKHNEHKRELERAHERMWEAERRRQEWENKYWELKNQNPDRGKDES